MDNYVKSKNGYIFTKPFTDKGLKTKETSGFTTVAQKHELTALETLYDSETLPAGFFVYVRGESFKQPWAKEIFKINGQEAIAVPDGAVLLASEKLLTQDE